MTGWRVVALAGFGACPSGDRPWKIWKAPRSYQGALMSTSTWIIIGVVVVFVLWIIMVYNGLVAMRQRVNQAFADIDVQMKQRHDLIPNLVETVKGYASHESGTLRQLFALSEAYPDLKANTNFQQLQGELSDIENKLAAARRFYNNAVQEYNTGIQQFPAVLLAGSLGFSPKGFFDVGEERATLDKAPQVKF